MQFGLRMSLPKLFEGARGPEGFDRAIHEANRLSWNEATAAHNSHKGGQAEYLRAGGTTLFPEEIRLLGSLEGKRVVHLLCNAGADTVSLALRGAEVTGVDISDVAVQAARELAAEVGVSATFVRADVYDWLADEAARGGTYDVAFCSYGALCWLSSLELWASGVGRILRPGGRFVCVEFHPLAYMFGEGWKLAYPYQTDGLPITTDGVPDYVAEAGDGLVPWTHQPGVGDFVNPYPDHTYPWGIGQIVTALAGAGLRVERLEEYPYSNGAMIVEGMRDLGGRRWGVPEGVPELPLMFGLAARRHDLEKG